MKAIKSSYIRIRLTEDDRNNLDSVCKNKQMTISQFLRDFIQTEYSKIKER